MTTIADTTFPTNDELDARVARGMLHLDANRPGWLDVIDVDVLDIAYTDRCVGGQLAPDHLDGDSRYFHTMNEIGLCDEEQRARHGFTLGWQDERAFGGALRTAEATEIYAPLTSAWVRAIAARRDGAA